MKRWRWPFGGLYWRLTVSYFLVALVAVLTVEAAVTVVPLFQDYQAYNAANHGIQVSQTLKQEAAPQIATYLERNPPDRDALNGIALAAVFPLSAPLGELSFAQIMDHNGHVLAAAAGPNAPAQSLLATPESQAVLHAALVGDQQSADLQRTLPDGQSVFATAIVSDQKPSQPLPQALGFFFAVCSARCNRAPKQIAFLLAPALEQSPPNRDTLNGWLWLLMHNANNPASQGGALRDTLPGDALLVETLNRDGQILASATTSADVSQTLLGDPQVRAATQAALGGSAQTEDLTHGLSGARDQRETVVATPIFGYDGRLIGAVITVFIRRTASSGLEFVISDFYRRLEPLGFIFLALATAVGTLTGVLVALSLSRRLRRISQAADAWSRGELRVEARDPARDEIGQLARRLNGMAGQLHTLLTTRQALAVVEERNRLARELHDSVKQHVFATALLVRSARKQLERSPSTATQHLAEAEELAGQTQQELTTLIRALRPAALADKGLATVLREYSSDWSRRTSIASELRAQGERATPLDVEEALFRIAQEALANAARHSAATQVDVWLTWEDDTLALVIRDDGKGFDPDRAAGKGLGLASMRERAEAQGGALTIASSPAGTTVAARIPLAFPPVFPLGAAEPLERTGDSHE